MQRLPIPAEYFEVFRQVIHIRRVEVPRFTPNNRIEGNLDLRIKYMQNFIDEKSFKSNIQRREKENSKRNEIRSVLTMYLGCMTDILFRLKDDYQKFYEIFVEMNNLRIYTNECLRVISKSYNCKLREINNGFKVE